MSVSAAKSRVMQAKMQLDSNRADDAESTVAAGLKFLEGLPDSETAAVRAELLQIRAAIASRPKPEDLRNISAAKGKISQARSQLDAKQLSSIADTLRVAEDFLKSVPETAKAALVAEIAAIRGGLSVPAAEAPRAAAVEAPRASGAASPRPTPQAVVAPAPPAAKPAAPAAAPAALSDDDYVNLSRAKGRLNQAKALVESRRTENVESILAETAEYISKLPAATGAPLTAEVAAIRQQLGGAVAAEDTRRIMEELERHLGTVQTNLTLDFRTAAHSRDHVEKRLQDEEVKRILPADALAKLQARAADLRKRLDAAIKADAMERAMPILAELEASVATDPFAGKEQHEAYQATSALETLKHRVRAPLWRVPDGDADVAAIEARLRAVDVKIDEASAKWGRAELTSQVNNTWSFVEQAISGWEAEALSSEARPLETPDLPKTRLAIQRIRYLLDDPATQKIRAENQGDATIEATYRAAEEIFDKAAAKMNDAFAGVLEAGEKIKDAPLNRIQLDRPNLLSYEARQSLAGTKYAEAAFARAQALDQRWRAEVAAIMKARAELTEKLTAEADAAWPAIADRIQAIEFNPDTVKQGDLIKLEGVYNRCGWDYSGRAYDFAMLWGETVLAGAFEPHIVKAIEHACYELKVGFSDRYPWDVYAVVEKPGKIGERTQVIVRDKFTNFELGKFEEWPSIDCLRVRIVALHAGPVAVGQGGRT
ncbi:MAG TPA: hypothetical protein VH083_22025 [Myxococcales bacterium]|nr:hypothetical protein [Myxococcales bacterium]